jgi:SlyX protein
MPPETPIVKTRQSGYTGAGGAVMSEETQGRFEELETRNAYQEATIQDLSSRIYEQQLQIDRLEARLASLAEKVKGLAAGESAPLPENERPPHY